MGKIIKILFAGVVVFSVAFSIFVLMGKIPDTKALTGAELSDFAKQELVESGIISKDEKVQYFYSEDFASFVEYGNLFTDIRVISYEMDQDSDSRNLYHARYNEISDIKFTKSEGALGDSLIEIFESGEHSFSLVVSNEEKRDEVFYEKLVQLWKSNQANPEQEGIQ